MNLAGRHFDFAKLAARSEPPRPPRPRRRARAPEPPEVRAARARYHETRAALDQARTAYQHAKVEHGRSKATLAALRARAGAPFLGRTLASRHGPKHENAPARAFTPGRGRKRREHQCTSKPPRIVPT